MEASVATPQAPAEPEESHDGEAEATRSTEELFQWSGYVHVGRGADGCEHGVDGACDNSEHFHAWVCLPNTFQFRDIDGKAKAAKARKSRALRDPQSDSYAILEAELDDVQRDHYDDLLDALSRARAERFLPQIIDDLASDERFENRGADAEEFRRLAGLAEDERDKEEYERLQKDMLDYADAVQAEVDNHIKRERAQLEAMPRDEVVELERKSRIENISGEIYYHTYYTWAMYVGAREPTTEGFPSKRKFAKPEDMHNAPPEVVVALRDQVRTLETRTIARGDAAGNS